MWLSDRLDFHTLRSSTLSLAKINPNSFRTGVSAKHPSLLFTCLLLFILTLPEGILPAVSKHRFQITNENSLLARKPRVNESKWIELSATGEKTSTLDTVFENCQQISRRTVKWSFYCRFDSFWDCLSGNSCWPYVRFLLDTSQNIKMNATNNIGKTACEKGRKHIVLFQTLCHAKETSLKKETNSLDCFQFSWLIGILHGRLTPDIECIDSGAQET